MKKIICVAALFWVAFVPETFAGEANLAVAANFLEPARRLVARFESQSEKQLPHKVKIISGSTGKLYAQTIHGAPFDVLLAADSHRPRLLEGRGDAVAGSRFTYALGRLALWSADPKRINGDGRAALKSEKFQRLALANPKTAPYGLAAEQTLRSLKLWERLGGKVVRGENVAQAFHFVATENAELGFVALSQVLTYKKKGSHWEVPASLHEPIAQDAVLLTHGKANPAAKAFLEFLRGEAAKKIIRELGYARQAPGGG